MKKIAFLLSHILFLFLFSCDNNKVIKTPIKIGDTSTIVTENDSTYLQNFTEDITPSKTKSHVSEISKMMVQVDSVNTQKILEEDAEENKTTSVNGFTINFNEISVIMDGIAAHALNETQNERATNSVSYIKDAGNLLETKMLINGTNEFSVEQRFFVKLSIVHKDEEFILNDLGKYITQWYPLAGKDNLVISVGANSLQFDSFDETKLKNALDRELRKKKKRKDEMQNWFNAIAQVKTYRDAPCKLIPVSSQWRIIGKKDGKSFRKLIQLDVPH